MSLRIASSFSFFFAALVGGCAEPAPAEESARASAASTASFVGCRPSAGECRSSCPDGRYRFEDPDPRCPGAGDHPRDTGACLCGAEPEPPPQAPSGTFIGCRPSAGECSMSCPTRQGSYVERWPACPEAGDPGDMHGGCFCR